MAYYHICPRCGSYLDPGEKCDCKQKEWERYTKINRIADCNGQVIWQQDDGRMGGIPKTGYICPKCVANHASKDAKRAQCQ